MQPINSFGYVPNGSTASSAPIAPVAPVAPTRNDPAPSKWSYRFQRLMLTPVFRRALRIGVPFCLFLGLGMAYFGDQDRRDMITNAMADMRMEFQTRPEFMVGLMAIDGASEQVNDDIRQIAPIDFPISSFDLNLEVIRTRVVALASVRDASVRIRNGGVLQIDVAERVPVAIWRTRRGLELIDNEGVAVGRIATRGARENLPLIAGLGAATHLDEALALFHAAGPSVGRVRGMVRVGARRWDVILDRKQRIMLPESAPVQALERVMALSGAQDMLARDLAVVDMRLAGRATIRMNTEAAENWWQIREISTGNN